jgi:ABC-type oligopeptide transport system ATPase subunit
MSDRIAVMRAGRIVELGDAEDVYANPRDEYTRALLQSVPIPDPRTMKERKKERLRLRAILAEH